MLDSQSVAALRNGVWSDYNKARWNLRITSIKQRESATVPRCLFRFQQTQSNCLLIPEISGFLSGF